MSLHSDGSCPRRWIIWFCGSRTTTWKHGPHVFLETDGRHLAYAFSWRLPSRFKAWKYLFNWITWAQDWRLWTVNSSRLNEWVILDQWFCWDIIIHATWEFSYAAIQSCIRRHFCCWSNSLHINDRQSTISHICSSWSLV